LKKIFLLLPGIFSLREYLRFGVETLEKNFLIRTLDFTPWLYPQHYKIYSNKKFYYKNNVPISSEEDLLNLLDTTHPDIVIDCLQNNKKTKRIRKIIKKNGKSLFVGLFINSVPYPKINIRKTLKILISKPREFFYKLFEYINSKYYYLTKFKSDLGVVGGLCNISKAKDKSKELIYAHCTDYDIYLDIKDKPANNKNSYAVFLDGAIAYHPDRIIDNVIKGNPNAQHPIGRDEYYSLLVKFFNKFEKETKLPVIFATHPKTPNNVIEKFPDLLKGIKYQIGNTGQLVRSSNMVLVHQSTSFAFAVLFNKPAVFLTLSKLKKFELGPRIDNLAKVVNGQVINLDNDLNKPLDFQKLSKIDKGRYKNYLDQHIKMPDSPDIPLWEIVTDYIKRK
jgi:hypothetical protein|tara:strand:- start:86 stop:1264 length:1179 start_codon:yes stop_codon:yes gene_type:complete